MTDTTTDDARFCLACGHEASLELDSPGVSHHVDHDGYIDYAADADHVAILPEPTGPCACKDFGDPMPAKKTHYTWCPHHNESDPVL